MKTETDSDTMHSVAHSTGTLLTYDSFHTTRIGDVTEAIFLTEFLRFGLTVSQPFSHGARYDLVVDFGGKLYRIQCKTARIKKGCYIYFPIKGGYIGQADYFGIYCRDNQQSYLVPVQCVQSGAMRLEPSVKSLNKRLPLATDYTLQKVVSELLVSNDVHDDIVLVHDRIDETFDMFKADGSDG